MQLYGVEVQAPLGFETRQQAPQDANEMEARYQGGEQRPRREDHGDRKRLKKIEAIIRPATFDIIRYELEDLCVEEIIVTEVRTCARRDVRKQFYRGAQYEVLLPKMKVEIFVLTSDLADAIKVFSPDARPAQACFHEEVLVYDVAEAIGIPHDRHAGSALL